MLPATKKNWQHWKRRYGPETLNASKGLYFSDETHALQAAVAGQGVVIASSLLAEDLITRNMLTTPFNWSLPGANYYLVTMNESAGRPEVVLLREWIIQEMQRSTASVHANT